MKNFKLDLREAIGDNKKTDCFAYSDNPSYPCMALTDQKCRNCPFYKTNGKMAKELLRCSNRLKEVHSAESDREYALFQHYANLADLV